MNLKNNKRNLIFLNRYLMQFLELIEMQFLSFTVILIYTYQGVYLSYL